MHRANMNLAPGMLALIIACQRPENQKYIGMVVTLDKYVPDNGILPGHHTTKLLQTDVHGWIVLHPEFPGDELYRQGVAFWAPEHLMPLPPLPEHERTKEKELDYV